MRLLNNLNIENNYKRYGVNKLIDYKDPLYISEGLSNEVIFFLLKGVAVHYSNFSLNT